MNAADRAARRQDLLMASELLRGQLALGLDALEPLADKAWQGVVVALWLRRAARLIGQRRVAPLAGLLAGLGGSAGLAWLLLRRWRLLRTAFLAWRVWRRLRG